MNTRQMTDWEQYALIVHVVRRLGGGRPFGRKALQKVVYLLQEHAGIPANFRYTFYTYGVYSFELANTLSAVENMKGVQALYDHSQNIYFLSEGERADALEVKGKPFLDRHKSKIEEVISLASDKIAKDLELITTIVFVALNENLGALVRQSELIARVKELKPKFEQGKIENQIAELREQGFFAAALKRKVAK
jgi:uncharacterized protein YwgA